MVRDTLEHKVLIPDNIADSVAEFERWDSIAEIQSRRAGTPLNGIIISEKKQESMKNSCFYGSNAAGYSIKNGNHILEIYDLNNEDNFPDKSEFITTLRQEGNYFSKVPDIGDTTKTINLSDEKFNQFVTKANDNHSYINYEISDVTQGKDHFENVYGTEATKLFTAIHGEEAYGKGAEGRFKNRTTNIAFMNQNITESELKGKEEGTKLFRGAYICKLTIDSDVGLDDMFGNQFAEVSGIVNKSGKPAQHR